MNASRPVNRLVYFSRQAPALGPLAEALDSIIEASVRNNGKLAVTGLLLAHQGWFLQALEGPMIAVQSTYGRILNDARHAEAHVVSAGPVDARSFGAWAMCARSLGTHNDAILDVLDQRGDFVPSRLNAASALRLLSAVAAIRGNASAAA